VAAADAALIQDQLAVFKALGGVGATTARRADWHLHACEVIRNPLQADGPQ